jgi:hypothetical protein
MHGLGSSSAHGERLEWRGMIVLGSQQPRQLGLGRSRAPNPTATRPHKRKGIMHGWVQLFQLQQLHCTSRPAMAPPVLLQGQEEQSGRFGESWHVEYHPRVVLPWNIASKRATAITALTNYA